MIRSKIILSSLLALLGGSLLLFSSAAADPLPQFNPSATPGIEFSPPPPTIYPPSQADNGAQIYWGMCQDCHGDQGQGLTAEWRAAFAPQYQNCWEIGCHGEDAPQHSFQLPESGAPALAAPGALPQFKTAFELGSYIQSSMPLSPAGSISSDQAWELTAFLLRLKHDQEPALMISGTTGAALPVHQALSQPSSFAPGASLLALVLLAAGIAVSQGALARVGNRPYREGFYHHLHPPRIPARQSRLGYTLGAGGLAVFLSLVLLITGALEMFYYSATPETAASSIQVITHLVPFGGLIRNLHFWSAQLLVLVVMLHLVRIILTGAYAPPRRFNYVLGLILLVVILLLDFTGYVLRWDEGIRWALVVGTNLIRTIPGIGEGLYSFLIGGPEPGAAALTRFYSWHVYGLSLAAAGVTAWHIFKVRRDGGISSPPAQNADRSTRIPRDQLVQKEIAAMLIGGGVLLLLAILVPAPIDQPIAGNQGLVGDSRAPWFFLWIQETLGWGDPFWFGVALPLIAVLILGLLPYLLPNAKPEEWGSWLPVGNRWGQILGILIISLILFLTILGWLR